MAVDLKVAGVETIIKILSHPQALDAFLHDQEVIKANPRIRDILEKIAVLLRGGNVLLIGIHLPGHLDELAKEFPQFFEWAQRRIDTIISTTIKNGPGQGRLVKGG